MDPVITRTGYEYLLYTREEAGRYIGRGADVVPFRAEDLTAIGPGRGALCHGAAYDISVAELGGRHLRVRRTVEGRPVSADEAARFVEEYVAGYSEERRADVRSRFEQVTAASHLPTHAGLAFDSDGNLWVEGYRPPRDTHLLRTWSVFDPDGRWLGDLDLPHGLRVDEIGKDYIAGVERDDVGVEYVRVYRVVKP